MWDIHDMSRVPSEQWVKSEYNRLKWAYEKKVTEQTAEKLVPEIQQIVDSVLSNNTDYKREISLLLEEFEKLKEKNTEIESKIKEIKPHYFSKQKSFNQRKKLQFWGKKRILDPFKYDWFNWDEIFQALSIDWYVKEDWYTPNSRNIKLPTILEENSKFFSEKILDLVKDNKDLLEYARLKYSIDKLKERISKLERVLDNLNT